MNLARVEYYLSDFLSIIETRTWKDNEIKTDNIVLEHAAEALYPEIYIPENLYLIGTVNMDETTFPFSKKVLDRANTIEFSYVDFDFTAENGVRDTSDIIEKYRKGTFAALPDPELINSLLSIKGNVKEAVVDGE